MKRKGNLTNYELRIFVGQTGNKGGGGTLLWTGDNFVFGQI